MDALNGLVQDALPVLVLGRVLGQDLSELVELTGELLKLFLGRGRTFVLRVKLPLDLGSVRVQSRHDVVQPAGHGLHCFGSCHGAWLEEDTCPT